MHSRDLPSGTVTFLFTDIEGSTRLLRELGEAYVTAFVEHRRILREAFTRHSGVEVGTGAMHSSSCFGPRHRQLLPRLKLKPL